MTFDNYNSLPLGNFDPNTYSLPSNGQYLGGVGTYGNTFNQSAFDPNTYNLPYSDYSSTMPDFSSDSALPLSGENNSGKTDSFSNIMADIDKAKEAEAEKAKQRKILYAQKQFIETGVDANGNSKFKVETNEQGEVTGFAQDEQGNLIPDANGMEIPDSLAAQKKAKATLVQNSSKKSDGSVTTSMSAEEYEKLPWWQRGLRALGNVAKGTLNMAKSLAGFDEKGNWNWKKLLTNGLMIVGGIALTAVCPAAGPALLYAGLAMGAVKAGTGVVKTFTAKNVEEIDAAWQDVGEGAATVVASRAGLKSMAKAASASTGAEVSMWNAKSLMAAQPKSAISFKGGFKWEGAQFKANLKNMNPFRSKAKEPLANAEKAANDQIATRISEIDNQLASKGVLRADEQAILANERAVLEAQKTQLTGLKTKTDFTQFATESKAHIRLNELQQAKATMQSSGSVEVGGVTLKSSNPADVARLEELINQTSTLAEKAEALSAAKAARMKELAYTPWKKASRDELTAYHGKLRDAYRINWQPKNGNRLSDYAIAKNWTPKSWYGKATKWVFNTQPVKALNWSRCQLGYGVKKTLFNQNAIGLMDPCYLLSHSMTHNPSMVAYKGYYLANTTINREYTGDTTVGPLEWLGIMPSEYSHSAFGLALGTEDAVVTRSAGDYQTMIAQSDQGIADIEKQMKEIDAQIHELA